MEEEREEAKGNPNSILYAVTVKTDVEIIVGNLLRQISAACSLFLHLEQYDCVRGQAAGEHQQMISNLICQNEA